MKTALSVAGTDPTGGAGIQADLKTFAAHGVYGMAAITAIVAQNTTGVISAVPVAASMIADQLEAVFADIFPDAVKVGMIRDRLSVEAVATVFKTRRPRNVVLDPVMVSSSGFRLLEPEAERILIDRLIPLTDLITPNLAEASVLSGIEIRTLADMEKAIGRISRWYRGSILLKGGHLEDAADKGSGAPVDCVDLLYHDRKLFRFSAPRVETVNTHGTGCTLSSAIAANLAQGIDLPTAVRLAKEYLTGALSTGLSLGRGRGPLDHLWKFQAGNSMS